MRPEPLVDSKALRDARERAGLTQHELARLIGVAGGERVSRWERGASEPRPEVLHRISAVLNVDTQSLLRPSDGAADLRRLRVLAGLSARRVAERSHMSLPTYARWESGQTNVPTGAALALQPDEVTPDTVTEAPNRLLGEPSFRQAAKKLRDEISEMPDAATVLKDILANRSPAA